MTLIFHTNHSLRSFYWWISGNHWKGSKFHQFRNEFNINFRELAPDNRFHRISFKNKIVQIKEINYFLLNSFTFIFLGSFMSSFLHNCMFMDSKKKQNVHRYILRFSYNFFFKKRRSFQKGNWMNENSNKGTILLLIHIGCSTIQFILYSLLKVL